jgi:hypothetical protein
MKTNSPPSRGREWQKGYLIGILLFIVGAYFSLYGEKNPYGFLLVMASLVTLLMTAWNISKRRFQSYFFSVGSALLVLSFILAGDMFDEMFVHDYPGWSGNGFLLDSVSTLLYLYIVPIFVLFGVIFLMKDSKNSLNQR